MKRIIIAALLVAGSFGFANAQATQTKATVKKSSHTASTVTAAPKTVTTAPVVKMKQTTTVTAKSGMKKDGTPDMRMKENKMAPKTAPAAGPLKKNGTPDMRYKANKAKAK